MLGVLLKKYLNEKLSVFKRDKARLDIAGNILSLLLAASIITAVVLVFARFIGMYCDIRINNVLDVPARQLELLTWLYAALFVLGVLSGAKAINHMIFESEDQKLLLALPIASSTIFYSKLIILYIRQVGVFLLTLLPLNLTFAVVAAQSAYYVVMTVLMCLFFPLITLAFSSVFCMPLFYIKRFLQSKYTLILVLVTAVTGVLFWGYTSLLSAAKTMLVTGELRFFFKESTMQAIAVGTKYFYPANLMAELVLKRSVLLNSVLLLAIVAFGAVLGFFIVSLLFNKANQIRVVTQGRVYSSRHGLKRRPLLAALIRKEFELVLRTPGYAFQYFSMAAVMPLMVYFCMGIGRSLLETLVFANSNFELALFVTLLFNTLTNTFCATNISRDGPVFYAMKTLPVPFNQIVKAKIIFCSLVAVSSALISCVVLAASGFVTLLEATFVFLAAALLAGAQICFATRKDLNHPVFSFDEDCEVKESNSTVSTIVIIGLLISTVLGGLSLYISVFSRLNGGRHAALFTLLFVGLSALGLFGGALAYLLTGLKKRFYEMTEGQE